MRLANILANTKLNVLVRRLMAFCGFISFFASGISFSTLLFAGLYFICLFMNENF